MWFYTLIVILLIVLVWLTQVRARYTREHFVSVAGIDVPDVDPASMPPPQEIFKKLRTLLDKYDKPEVWDHATQMIDKDPSQLARLNLGIVN
jgi:hypothetical protein